MTWELAMATVGISAPLTMAIFKFVPRRREDHATWKEVQHLREDVTGRLDVMQRDLNRIAHKAGLDIWSP